MLRRRALASACLAIVACSRSGTNRTSRAPAPPPASAASSGPSRESPANTAARAIDARTLLERVRTLASDRFEGRAPGTAGEELTVKYLVDAFKELGLEPGNPDGTFVQSVPLVTASMTYRASLVVGGRTRALTSKKDIVAATHRLSDRVSVDTDMVFVGYGAVAPEYAWDDFKDVDVHGKAVLILVGDPPVPDPADPSQLDPAVFRGKGLTYYGRWSYKVDIAAKKGAAAMVLVHETGPATYPFDVVVNTFGSDTYDIAPAQGATSDSVPPVGVEAWITESAARSLLSDSGQDYDALKRAAVSRSFRPVALKAKFQATVERQQREVSSQNVVAKVSGTEAGRYLLYSAHWDHLGRDPKPSADPIFHGALDNAAGVGALLETAKAFHALSVPPHATVVFLATTAEERGFLGAKYYVEHPLYPLGRTLADINFDGLNVLGKTRDLTLTGAGETTLEDDLRVLVEADGRVLSPERDPENGWSFRTDAFQFAKAGVPSIWYRRGADVVGKPPGYGLAWGKEYIAHDYHKPTDTVRADWDLSGAVEDVSVFFRLGYGLASGKTWPQWKAGAPFKSNRPAP
jgi:Zn-dependent M28 family amino/carboxypeptidase